jgi:uncharacterized membrane protein YdjX (TVP38/TMEM64 family)
MRLFRRLLPLILLAVAFAAIWWSGLASELTWAGLARNQALLAGWVDAHPLLAGAAYIVLYAVSTALSLPQGALLTLSGGLLFGAVIGTVLAVTGATAGAIALFLAARSALGASMEKRGGATMGKLRDALRKDGFSYLLAIRLLPLFPFWLVNLAASVCGMRLGPFALATFLGIIPATFVFASIGAGVGSVLAAGGTPNLSVIFSLPVLGPLVALALLSLAPIAWKKWHADAPL